MKKLCMTLVMIVVAVGGVFAQGQMVKAAKSARNVAGTSTKGARGLSGRKSYVKPQVKTGGRRPMSNSTGAVPAEKGASSTSVGGAANHPSHTPGSAVITPSAKPDLPTAEELRRFHRVKAENAALEGDYAGMTFHADFGKSVLFAPDSWDPNLGYSVTTFKTYNNGLEEIFGVIPSHALPKEGYIAEFGLDGKQFSVRVLDEQGREILLPVEVVQISSPSMLDISLIKFPEYAQSFLKPLELDTVPVTINDNLFSYGYAAGMEQAISRHVTGISFLSVRTNQALEGERAGFCGSPLLDEKGRIKAIHTGTVEGNIREEDVSYGTHAQFVQMLVDAYHNQGKRDYPLTLENHSLAYLNVDEYISDFTLFDSNMKPLFRHEFEEKFSQSAITNALHTHPDAVFIQLTSRRVQWNSHGVLEENRTLQDTTQRTHLYDVKNKQIISEKSGL